MSIQQAEQLKRQWTDKHVMVQEGVPELQRFSGLLGKVKTVNMNCRLLIEFETTADISWYDIDPQFARVIDPAELTTPTADIATHGNTKTSNVSETASAKKPAVVPSKPTSTKPNPLDMIRMQVGKSPLDTIRTQGVANKTANAATSLTAAAPPLDLIRKQASKTPSPKPTSKTSVAGKSPSSNPLDLIRAQTSSATTSTKTKPAAAQPALNPPTPINTPNSPAAAQPIPQPEADAPTSDNTGAPESKSTLQPWPLVSADSTSSSSAIDQIRAQAAADSQDSTEAADTSYVPSATIFDQVKAQADRDEFAATEDSAKLQFNESMVTKRT